MRQKVANYKRLRELMNEWVSLGVGKRPVNPSSPV
jgi:hypothetical protein